MNSCSLFVCLQVPFHLVCVGTPISSNMPRCEGRPGSACPRNANGKLSQGDFSVQSARFFGFLTSLPLPPLRKPRLNNRLLKSEPAVRNRSLLLLMETLPVIAVQRVLVESQTVSYAIFAAMFYILRVPVLLMR